MKDRQMADDTEKTTPDYEQVIKEKEEIITGLEKQVADLTTVRDAEVATLTTALEKAAGKLKAIADAAATKKGIDKKATLTEKQRIAKLSEGFEYRVAKGRSISCRRSGGNVPEFVGIGTDDVHGGKAKLDKLVKIGLLEKVAKK